jgi:hypothetical protein
LPFNSEIAGTATAMILLATTMEAGILIAFLKFSWRFEMKTELDKEIVDILLESDLYLDLSLIERGILINRIKDSYHLEVSEKRGPDNTE